MIQFSLFTMKYYVIYINLEIMSKLIFIKFDISN